jgi:serine/threonine-protein phosphatase 2A regulatory subunit A
MKKTVESPSPTVELIKNLKDSDDNIKLYSISQLPQIAHILGPQRLTAELLPYLQEFLNDEENILIKLCQALSYIKIPPSNSTPDFF